MSISIKSKVVKIGNSRGIRIPRTMLEQARLSTDVELIVEGGKLIIYSARKPRQDWITSFEKMSLHGDDQLLDQDVGTRWDEEEWTW